MQEVVGGGGGACEVSAQAWEGVACFQQLFGERRLLREIGGVGSVQPVLEQLRCGHFCTTVI